VNQHERDGAVQKDHDLTGPKSGVVPPFGGDAIPEPSLKPLLVRRSDLQCWMARTIRQLSAQHLDRDPSRHTFLGIAPTGKQVTINTIDIWRVEGGKLAEHWDVIDIAGIRQQLAPPSATQK
jgi:SnoaL-like polyketide cyclase